MGAWQFLQDEILGMKWLNRILGEGLSRLGLSIGGRLGGSVQFFLYDVIKITVLLCFLIFVISYIQSYFPPERSKKILGRFHGIGANILSALLGTVTPFCSCSSIPLFIGFTSAGLRLCQVPCAGAGRPRGAGGAGHGHNHRPRDGFCPDRRLWRDDDPGAGGGWKGRGLWQGAQKGRGQGAHPKGAGVGYV